MNRDGGVSRRALQVEVGKRRWVAEAHAEEGSGGESWRWEWRWRWEVEVGRRGGKGR